MNATDAFSDTIKKYLDDLSTKDEKFNTRYQIEGKSIENCCNYIIAEVQNIGKIGFADEEIYALAVKYYESDEKVVKKQRCTVVVNKDIPAAAKEEQEEDSDNEPETPIISKPKEEPKKTPQMSLF